MTRHTGAVLCVRWSPKGRYLASSADDSLVLIWQRAEDRFGGAAFEAAAAGLDETPTESYNALMRLAGHESDVNGLEWSLDGRFLASCGIDGRVLVWDVDANFTLLKRLEGEPRRPLKGVAWDPLGQFLAAQCNDGAVYIWRTGDWRLESIVASPYAEAVESLTYFSRPAWSPDGQVLCIPDAVNESETVALLVERGKWTGDESLVGHASSVQVAKFSPRLYRTIDAEDSGSGSSSSGSGGAGGGNGTTTTFLVVALGAQDGMVSLWSSGKSKPIAVLGGLFEHAIMDLEWSADGKVLLAASYDGTVARISVTEAALGGRAVPVDEQATMVSKLSLQQQQQHQGGALSLPTSVNQVIMQRQVELDAAMTRVGREPTKTTESSAAPIAAAGSLVTAAGTFATNSAATTAAATTTITTTTTAATAAPSSSQTESKTRSGKRRIAPQLLQAVPAVNDQHASAGSAGAEAVYTVRIGKPQRKAWLKPMAPFRHTHSLAIGDDAGGDGGCIEVTLAGSGTRICRLQGRRLLWENRVECQAVGAATASDGTLVCALANCRLVVFSPAGRRLLPPIVLAAHPAQLVCSEDICVVVLENGLFSIWRLPGFVPVAADELPPHGLMAELTQLRVHAGTDSLVVEFCFANAARLVYCQARRAFFELDDSSQPATDALIQAIWGSTDGVFDASLIPRILALDTAELRNRTLAHMEAQIAVCALIGDTVQLVPWLCAYAQRLAIDEDFLRARELMESLGGYGVGDVAILRSTLASYLLTSPAPMVRRLAEAGGLGGTGETGVMGGMGGMGVHSMAAEMGGMGVRSMAAEERPK